MSIWERALRHGGWRWLERLGGRDTCRVLARSLAISALQGQSRSDVRLRLLVNTLAQSAERVPFYRDHKIELSGQDRWESLHGFPVATKDDLRRDARSFVATDLAEAPSRSVSGGSTGSPVTSYCDPEASGIVKAALIEGRAEWGIHPWSRCLSVWGHAKYLGSGLRGRVKLGKRRLLDAVANRRVIPAYDLGKKAVLKFNRAWKRDKPDFIVGYASALYEIVRLHEQLKLPIPCRNTLFMSTGEVLHDWQEEYIREVTGCRVMEEYGLVEAGAIAYTNRTGEGLKVITSHFVVELLRDDDSAVEQGEEGWVVVTSLHREGVPVLRYDTGDRATCLDPRGGSDARVMSKVSGRTYDLIRLKDGTAVPGVIFTHSLKSLKEIDRFEVVQRELGRVEIRYSAGKEVKSSCLQQVANKILSEAGPSFEVFFEQVDELRAAPSGKFRWIRSEIKE